MNCYLFSCFFFSHLSTVTFFPVTFFLLVHCYFLSCYFFSYLSTVTFFPVTFFPVTFFLPETVTFFPVTFFPVTFFPCTGKDSRKTVRESLKCWDLVRLILETWRYMWCPCLNQNGVKMLKRGNYIQPAHSTGHNLTQRSMSRIPLSMMTSSNGKNFRVTGHLCGEFTGPHLNKRLSKQSWGWWFETLSRPLWCRCNGLFQFPPNVPFYTNASSLT